MMHERMVGLRVTCMSFLQYFSYVRTMLLLLFCCFSPRYTSKVMSGRSVSLSKLFLGRLRPPRRLTSTSWTNFHP